MKVIALLLSFLILASVGTPCEDEISHDDIEVSAASDHQEDHAEEFCSPFCFCQCEHPTTFKPLMIELQTLSQNRTLNTGRVSIYSEDWVFKDIHPPRQAS
jgi:hypothetical protein